MPDLAEACMASDIAAVTAYLQQGYSPDSKTADGFPALCNAAFTNFPAMVSLLVDNGANVNIVTPTNANAAWVACEANAVDCLRILAEKGIDLNNPSQDGQTPSMAAACNGHLECLRILAQYNANIALVNPTPGDYQGQTALSLAEWKGHTEVVAFIKEVAY